MHEDFQYILSENGPPEPGPLPTGEDIRFMNEHLPANYVEFVSTYSFGSYLDCGCFFVEPRAYRSLITMIFKGRKDFHHTNTFVLGYSAFGKLDIWSKEHYVIRVDLLTNEVSCPALAPSKLTGPPIPAGVTRRPITPENMVAGIIPDKKDDCELWDLPDGEPMFARCQKLYGRLEHGECYGFVPALGLVGGYHSRQRNVDNIKRLSALEHFTLIASLHDFALVRLNRGKKEVVEVF